MSFLQVVFLVTCLILGCNSNKETEVKQLPYPIGDVRNCLKNKLSGNQSFNRMVVLPGIGFDNLRDLDMGQVHAYNFSKCQVSNDGKYLLPDSMMLIPAQESKVDVFAEHIEHWDDYTTMTSASIAVHFGFMALVSAKFSAGYSQIKSHMHDEKSDLTRVQVRNKICTVKLQPGAELHLTFKSRLYDIVANFQNNNTEFAHYLAELMIKDYGTHVITSMDAGAILSQIDFIKKDDQSDSSQRSIFIKSSTSANFFGRLSIGFSFNYNSSTSSKSSYLSSRTHSFATNVGGPPLTPNITLDEWERGVPNALAPIDRSGDPLHFAINPTTLPSLEDSTVLELAGYMLKRLPAGITELILMLAVPILLLRTLIMKPTWMTATVLLKIPILHLEESIKPAEWMENSRLRICAMVDHNSFFKRTLSLETSAAHPNTKQLIFIQEDSLIIHKRQ